MGDNSYKKKIWVTFFFMRNPYMKFQNISIHGSKVMLCTRKCDERTNRQARSNMPPPNFFKVGGIKTFPSTLLPLPATSRPCPTVSQYQLDAPVTQDTQHLCLIQPPLNIIKKVLLSYHNIAEQLPNLALQKLRRMTSLPREITLTQTYLPPFASWGFLLKQRICTLRR